MDSNNKTFFLFLSVILFSIFGGVILFDFQPDSDNSYYSKTNTIVVDLVRIETNKIAVKTNVNIEKYCIKSTKTIPKKNNTCWKNLTSKSLILSDLQIKNNYLWLIYDNENMSQTIILNDKNISDNTY